MFDAAYIIKATMDMTASTMTNISFLMIGFIENVFSHVKKYFAFFLLYFYFAVVWMGH